jgi:murein DD-endopeptidase MepM/ murein hydrolase activator NlpD
MIRFIIVFIFALSGLVASRAARVEFVWPTPNKAWEQGRGIEAFIQPTVSGDPESGLFGCVRSGGGQFHEGLDIKCVQRDRRGEPTDPVFAAMDGVVRYVARVAGESNYGRYIVLEHPSLTPAVYTLYAHLARVESDIRPGVTVRAGQVIAIMGHSSSGSIPRDRAHLHFEIGLRVSDNFESWYHGKKFGNANEHGVWNGMNLMGFDPLDFLRQWRAGRVEDFQQYLDHLHPVVKLRVVTTRLPDFIQRYPALLQKPLPAGLIGGWEVACSATGLPFAWTPLTSAEVAGQRAGAVEILTVDASAVRAYHCKSIVKMRRGGYEAGDDLQMMLQQVFGVR